MGSSDSKTVRCFAPRSWIRSPRMTVTEPLANPTASWERSSSTARADIYHTCQTNTIVEEVQTSYGKLPAPILHQEGRQTSRLSGLLLGLIQSPHLQNRVIR